MLSFAQPFSIHRTTFEMNAATNGYCMISDYFFVTQCYNVDGCMASGIVLSDL